MDILLDTKPIKEVVIQAGIAIFQYIYHGPDTTLGEIRYMFSRKAVAGVIKPATLPPAKGAVAQHALRGYICKPGTGSFYRASLNSSDYGWTLGVHWYEPVPTLDPMALEGLLKFTSCNCRGDRGNRWCTPVAARTMGSCAFQPVESANSLYAKTAVMMLLSLKKIDNVS